MILGVGLDTVENKVNATELLKIPVVMNKSATSRSVYKDVSTVITYLTVITGIMAAMQAFK
jgi:hypothetical protein